MPPEGRTRAGILPGCPSLDRVSRVAEVGFEPRTFRGWRSCTIIGSRVKWELRLHITTPSALFMKPKARLSSSSRDRTRVNVIGSEEADKSLLANGADELASDGARGLCSWLLLFSPRASACDRLDIRCAKMQTTRRLV
ncbi:hypothetical protein T265_11748 [Opisthorchis viverrini]|uniref:Uncharacterized protein n=1 Tax=Opisthorchis viverrini TaxID=6198 RepID=A0A074ZWA7_OPIVI|nr:hypothetical protein T265_11748 [Opisthorchis viverrini]KER19489.1 hypothetical protein T265_11748 [Opisthorchis viverrini]